ncbi:aminoglycoside phosphotransferase family protein [Aspergillus ibericus CBS 121593]|uniref:Phosphotransferase enzyme family protein n=1 Tax=Aspergillus ibericus CBS 121593 TaxID=1448316 RepID=A0A395H154_9EURO|nr:phosphotransferase enzyme family protein [Aspergillus ibericus CBS 121593]RAL01363.1 phosphotransferase enzyme family protein [Aspergillus ibericus CBS 121593]
MKTFSKSSFFMERRAPSLPSPADIRALNVKTGNASAWNFNSPPPVMIPSLGLVVKYGASVSIVEAETQMMLREQLHGRVPVPEIFGWTEDEGQTFIYMSLAEGDTLSNRWDDLSDDARRAICEELNELVNLVRTLEQDPRDMYIGSLSKRPLNDIFVMHHPDLTGPFLGGDAVEQFQNACGIYIDIDTPVVFTHNDLLPPNIIISPGANPKVAAIIDWAQAGWYPAYWEYCKARWIRVNPRYFSDAAQDDWRNKYLPMILDSVDDETIYHPWLYFVLSKGI